MRSVLRIALLVSGVGCLAAGDSKAQFTVTGASIRLYEQDGGFVLDEAKRMYSTRFDALRSRYVGVEVSLTHSAVTAIARFRVNCEEVQPDGKTIAGMLAIPVDIQPNQTHSTGANTLFGGGPTGIWQEGTYRVRCTGGNRALGETAFQMTVNPSDVAGAEVRVARLQLFPTGAALVPVAERKYDERFDRESTTSIGVELSFTHPALGRALEISVDCYYFTPNGQTIGPIPLAYKPSPQATSGNAALGIGWDQPGQWPGGNYTAVCLINGHPVAVQRFVVN